jgi:hypothetical protein
MRRFCGLIACLFVFGSAHASDTPPLMPIDPFDYGYCGGQPVYPVIGVNFASFCGPRNQVALGRRGKLMWVFPSADGRSAHAQGARHLSTEELKRLSLLAEVAQLADPTRSEADGLNYQMGIDFQGRPYKRLHAVLTPDYTPANELLRAMLALVPTQPLLPDCAPGARYYDPTLLPAERKPLPEQPHAGLAYDRLSK